MCLALSHTTAVLAMNSIYCQAKTASSVSRCNLILRYVLIWHFLTSLSGTNIRGVKKKLKVHTLCNIAPIRGASNYILYGAYIDTYMPLQCQYNLPLKAISAQDSQSNDVCWPVSRSIHVPPNWIYVID